MAEIRQTLWCNRCQRNTGHVQEGVSHVLHFLITIFTCGLWAFAWFGITLMAYYFNDAHCTICGKAYSDPRPKGSPPPDW